MQKEFICKRMHKKLLICFASVDASVVQLGGGTRQAPGRGAGSCIVNTSNTPPQPPAVLRHVLRTPTATPHPNTGQLL